jgi:hypothetical protein
MFVGWPWTTTKWGLKKIRIRRNGYFAWNLESRPFETFTSSLQRQTPDSNLLLLPYLRCGICWRLKKLIILLFPIVFKNLKHYCTYVYIIGNWSLFLNFYKNLKC